MKRIKLVRIVSKKKGMNTHIFSIHRCQNNISLTSSIKFQAENSCTCFCFLGVWCFLFGRLWINQNINRLGSKDFCPFVEKFAGADEAVEQFRGELMDVPLAIIFTVKATKNTGIQQWCSTVVGGEARWLDDYDIWKCFFPLKQCKTAERKVVWGGFVGILRLLWPVFLLEGHKSTVKSSSRADTSIGSYTAIEVKEVQWRKKHKVQLMVKKYPVVSHQLTWKTSNFASVSYIHLNWSRISSFFTVSFRCWMIKHSF